MTTAAMNPSLSIGVIPLNKKDFSTANDPDLSSSIAALKRAALWARNTAIQTGTVVQHGQPIVIEGATLLHQIPNKNSESH